MPVIRKQYALMHFKNLINLNRMRRKRKKQLVGDFSVEYFQ
jgi:hypothetical protein